jgi:predicted hydrocarbon binding protein
MQSRSELHKEKGASLLIAMVYVEVFSRMLEKYGAEVAAEKLTTLGRNVTKTYYKYYKPHKASISGFVREIAEELAGMKDVKLKKTEDGFSISTTDCPICLPGVVIEGPAYCFPTMGIIEEFLNEIFEEYPSKFLYKKAIGRVVKSISSGATECEYHYRLIEK